MRFIILSPTQFILVAFIVSILSIYLIDPLYLNHNYILYFPVALLVVLSFSYLFSMKLFNDLFASIKLKECYGRKYMIVLILLVSFLEYGYFGLPVLGQIKYNEMGFPLLHHIAVSSWMLPLLLKGEESSLLSKMIILFALLNPILIFNRDLLLLTLYAMFFNYVLIRKISLLKALLVVSLTLVFFAILGYLRSPYGLATVKLPLSDFFYESNFIFQWVSLYLISPTFNFFNNLDTKEYTLFQSNINTFPESYNFYVQLDFFGFVFFYILIFSILFFVGYLMREYNRNFVLLYIYLHYQSIMTIFSNKFFTSHTVFVVILLVSFYLLGSHKKSLSS